MSETSGSEQGMDVPQGSTRRLVRRKEGKILAGVAAGLGEYFGVDPVWLRVGFVVASFLGGAGIVAYLVFWVVMPDGTGDSSAPALVERHAERISQSMRSVPSWVGVGLLVLGGLLVVTQIVDWRPGVFWGLTLIVLGVLLYRHREGSSESTSLAAPSPADATAIVETSIAPPLPHTTAPSSPLVKRERSRLGWMTLGGLLVALGVAGALDTADAIEMTLVQYLALALVVIGIGMVAGAWWGRARWLVVPGVLLVPFVLTASLIHVPFTGGFGDLLFHPASAQALEPEYHIIGGQIVLDLRNAVLGPEPVSITMTAVAGRIFVIVPAGMPVDVRARVGAGQVALFGRTHDGVRVDLRRTFTSGAPPGSPVLLRLDLEASLGQVQVGHVEEGS